MGHVNCQYNSITSLKGNTGAPGEQELNRRIADRLAAMLRERGFEVLQTDACANDNPQVTKTDFALFLALHGDADYPNDNGGGFADFPEPKTDGATAESQRIVGILNDVYFKETQIKYVNHSNANTRYYYMWKYLTAKTPCALIEMGQVQDPHDRVLLANTELIASALARAICKAFNVNYEITPPTPPEPTPCEKEVAALKKKISDMEIAGIQANVDFHTQLALKDKDCQDKLASYKSKVVAYVNSL
jgi:hypothetical protein